MHLTDEQFTAFLAAQQTAAEQFSQIRNALVAQIAIHYGILQALRALKDDPETNVDFAMTTRILNEASFFKPKPVVRG